MCCEKVTEIVMVTRRGLRTVDFEMQYCQKLRKIWCQSQIHIFLLFRYRTLPLILINLLSVPESMSDLLSFNRTDSIALSSRDKSGLIVIPGCVDSLDLPERIMETSEALINLTSKGRERFSSYLPNLKQSRIESSFTDSLIDEKIVAIDDWSLVVIHTPLNLYN